MERGYNQAEEIATALGRGWSIPVDTGLLIRRRDTESQTNLSPEARLENVRGVFTARSGLVRKQRPSKAFDANDNFDVILVDDILTTGATLISAAEALDGNGWRNIAAVTFARAMPFAVRIGMSC